MGGFEKFCIIPTVVCFDSCFNGIFGVFGEKSKHFVKITTIASNKHNNDINKNLQNL